MQDLSELDSLVAPEINDLLVVTTLHGLEKTMAEFFVLTKQSKEIGEKLKDLREIISAEADEEPGEYEIAAGEYTAKVKRPVKYTWDEDILERIIGGVTIAKSGIPDAVSTQLKVDKDKYDALPSHEKVLLSPALTVGPGASRITVVKKGAGDDDED